MKLATGVSYGGPYDVMGIGTYTEVGNDWVTVCGVTLRNGSFTLTERGFELSGTTQFGYQRPD